MATPLIVIVGQTASGKSALGLKLAEQFNGEIICADAWTVRRRADIGTAKPTKLDQARVQHHLLDIIEPDEKFNAAEFQRLATESISEISSRGRLPIMVGGSGLYIDGVIYDYSFLPSNDPRQRRELNSLNEDQLLEKLNELSVDVTNVDTKNKRRLVRLIETAGSISIRHDIRENTLVIGLQIEREQLKKQVEKRVDLMLEMGLENEVNELAQDYGWDCEALKAVGYKEWQDCFLGEASKQNVRENITRNNLELAKKQRTWFKRNKSIHWAETPVNWKAIVELVTTFLNS